MSDYMRAFASSHTGQLQFRKQKIQILVCSSGVGTLKQRAKFPGVHAPNRHELSDGHLQEEGGDAARDTADEVRDQEGTWKMFLRLYHLIPNIW